METSESRTNEPEISTMSRDRSDNDQFTSAQDQTLLDALQDFFVPLIQMVNDPKQLSARYRKPVGPEAMGLIKALKEYVSSIVVMHPREAETTIEVSIIDAEDRDGGYIYNPHIYQEDFKGPLISRYLPLFHQSAIIAQNPTTLKAPGPASGFHDNVLRTLRDHVFNKMPIRLLCLKPVDSGLQISLIERGSIYAHIEEKMNAKKNDPHYGPRHSAESRNIWSETDVEAIERIISCDAGYAILSHTWLRDLPEVTYSDWKNGQFNVDGPGYRKLINFCEIVWKEYGLTLAWMDTLCINKDSSSELDESIRSMYAWYKRAKVCVVYLAKSQTLAEMHHDPWFTRGWTLQELLAPSVLKFYSMHWRQFAPNLNDKEDYHIINSITLATTISSEDLKDIHRTPLSRRMQLAASRKVTREEDTAYSLMGIFNVSLAIAYGEGAERAFFRLLQGILDSNLLGVLDLLNWAGEAPRVLRTTNIFPTSPQNYVHRTTGTSLQSLRPFEPLILAHMRLRIPVLLMPGIRADQPSNQFTSIGDYWAKATVNTLEGYSGSVKITNTFHILDRETRRMRDLRVFPSTHRTFAVFNIHQGANGIVIPWTCIAFLLDCDQAVGKVTNTGRIKKVDTQEPVVFTMEKKGEQFRFVVGGEDIPVNELAKHGMQLISLYL